MHRAADIFLNANLLDGASATAARELSPADTQDAPGRPSPRLTARAAEMPHRAFSAGPAHAALDAGDSRLAATALRLAPELMP
jgi:hypothetical protein